MLCISSYDLELQCSAQVSLSHHVRKGILVLFWSAPLRIHACTANRPRLPAVRPCDLKARLLFYLTHVYLLLYPIIHANGRMQFEYSMPNYRLSSSPIPLCSSIHWFSRALLVYNSLDAVPLCPSKFCSLAAVPLL
jgi:hypothetical protein